MSSFETTLDIPTAMVDGLMVVVTVEVTVDYNPGWYTPAKLYGHPDSWEPEDGEGPEILSVRRLDTNQDVTKLLVKADFAKLTARASGRQSDNRYYDDEPCDYAY